MYVGMIYKSFRSIAILVPQNHKARNCVSIHEQSNLYWQQKFRRRKKKFENQIKKLEFQ